MAEDPKPDPETETPEDAPPPAPVDAVTGDLDQARAILEGRYAAQEVWMFLRARMEAFQKELPEHYEMGVKLANYGVAAEIHIRGMGFANPNIIEFYGLLDDGKEVILVQHVAQLNFMLMAVPPIDSSKPFRVGFGPPAQGMG